MNDDRLDTLARALREETERAPDRGGKGRTRLEAALRVQRRRRVPLSVTWAFAAALALGTALAAASPSVRNWVTRSLSELTMQKGGAIKEPRAQAAPTAPIAEAQEATATPTETEPPIPLSPSVRPPLGTPTPTHNERMKPAPADARELFRTAEEARSRDACADAVRLYDVYLARAEKGDSFLLEARFGRGACLVRLGRHDEAKAALAPFADGKYGTYRRDDAARLLE